MCKIFSFRLMEQFNEIVEFSVTDLFIWTLLNVSNCLLALQIDLVEYFSYAFLLFRRAIHSIILFF